MLKLPPACFKTRRRHSTCCPSVQQATDVAKTTAVRMLPQGFGILADGPVAAFVDLFEVSNQTTGGKCNIYLENCSACWPSWRSLFQLPRCKRSQLMAPSRQPSPTRPEPPFRGPEWRQEIRILTTSETAKRIRKASTCFQIRRLEVTRLRLLRISLRPARTKTFSCRPGSRRRPTCNSSWCCAFQRASESGEAESRPERSAIQP